MAVNPELRLIQAADELESDEWEVRLKAIVSVAALPNGVAKRLLDRFVVAAKCDGVKEVRVAAAECLANLPDPFPSEAAAQLGEALKDDRRHVRAFAADALSVIGPPAAAQVEGLLELVKDKASLPRKSAVFALGCLGQVASDNVDIIIDAMRDRDSEVRRCAVRALATMGPAACEQSLDMVACLLQDASYAVRRDAARTLAAYGEAAITKSHGLYQISLDGHAEVRNSSVEALCALRPATANKRTPHAGLYVKQFAEHLRDEDPKLRLHAAEAIRTQGMLAASEAQSISVGLKDAEPDIRHTTADFFAKLPCGAEDKPSILVERISDALLCEQDLPVQWALARALNSYGADASNQGTRFAEALDAEKPEVRHAGAIGLWALAHHATPHMAGLAERLGDDSWYVRRAAADALGSAGESAIQFTGKLLRVALNDFDKDVRQAAANALAAQGSPVSET